MLNVNESYVEECSIILVYSRRFPMYGLYNFVSYRIIYFKLQFYCQLFPYNVVINARIILYCISILKSKLFIRFTFLTQVSFLFTVVHSQMKIDRWVFHFSGVSASNDILFNPS